MDRRKFITHAGVAFTGMSILPSCLGKIVPDGEEWRKAENIGTYRLEYSESDWAALKTAQENIEKYRKVKTQLRFVDAEGQPLRETEVKIQQLQPTFDWGCSSSLHANDPRTEAFVGLFNCTTAKCYWDERWHQPIEKEEGKRIYDVFLKEVNVARELGLKVKGHPLVWTVRKALPSWLDAYSPEKRIEILKKHVQSMVEVGGDQVELWDLCNEMLWEPTFDNYLQRSWPHIEEVKAIADYIQPALAWAKEINPKAVYSLNDYGLEITYQNKISAENQRKRYVELIQELRSRGAAPDALGTQTHVGGWYSPTLLQQVWGDLAKAELPIQITEFWAHFNAEKSVNTLEGAKQQEYLIRYLKDTCTMAYGNPQISHFTFWGDDHFFTEQGVATPVYEHLRKLIREDWSTSLNAVTNTNGAIDFAGFKGLYAIETTQGQKIQVKIEREEMKELVLG